jgi:hypothetical protein
MKMRELVLCQQLDPATVGQNVLGHLFFFSFICYIQRSGPSLRIITALHVIALVMITER